MGIRNSGEKQQEKELFHIKEYLSKIVKFLTFFDHVPPPPEGTIYPGPNALGLVPRQLLRGVLNVMFGIQSVDSKDSINKRNDRSGKADGKLKGKEELRIHFRKGLDLAPDLRFDVEEILWAPKGYAVLYRRENGNRVLDAVELNEDGLAERVTA